MTKLKPLKDEKELAAVPLDEPVLVDLEPPATGAADTELKVEKDEPESGADTLSKQLQATKDAERTANDRADAAEREAREAREENERLKTAGADTEKELLTGSLAAAQTERDAAKAEYVKAFEAGDAPAMADANDKISRAATKIVNFEGAIAQFDTDAKIEKERPKTERPLSVQAVIDQMPDLSTKERDWLKDHPDTVTDAKLNRALAVGYDRAIEAGHKRGSDGYFQFLDQFMGYAKADPDEVDAGDDDNSERASIVAAPVSRDSRSVSGRPNAPNRITLSPGEREMARSMNLTDVQYARGKQQLNANKQADPEKYSARR